MKILLVLIFMLFLFRVVGQSVREPLTVHYAGLGAYSTKFSDIFSATSNQASLAQLKFPGFGVYGEKRFMLEELKGYTAVLAIPTASGTFGLQADYFGSAAFNENQLGLLYARKVSGRVDVSVKFNYHTIRTAGYGNVSAINFEAGTIFHLTDKLHSGVHVYNPTGSRLGKTGGEKLASIYRFGIGYEASKIVFLSAEIVKKEDQPVSVQAGIQYNVHEKVFFRTGISTLANNSYVGVGLQLGFARIDLNTAYHPQLGFTPGLLLLFHFKKQPKD